MLEYSAVRDQHIQQAQQQMGAMGHVYGPDTHPGFWDTARSAFRLAACWIADYARENPQWVESLKQEFKAPIVAGIVRQLNIQSSWELGLVSIFVGFLLDVAFNAFVSWAERGELGDAFSRWGLVSP